MAVILAKTAGFCWGVKRAMDMALKVSSEADVPIRTLGPLIHNRQAIELLKSKGVGQISEPAEAGQEMTVIIRAHGIGPETRAAILECGAQICDATCPHVVRAQRLVQRYTQEGYDAIVVGDRDHAETIGIVAHAARNLRLTSDDLRLEQSEPHDNLRLTSDDLRLPQPSDSKAISDSSKPTGGSIVNRQSSIVNPPPSIVNRQSSIVNPIGQAFVVESIEDIAALPRDLEKVVVVAQTTQEQERFERVAERLKQVYPKAEIHNTVCSDASNRQKELRELARRADAIVVVGGRHSANTKRLAQIAEDTGTPTWLVETAQELDAGALRAYRNIGVTAGASTPYWIINSVVERLEALDESKRPLPLRAAAAIMRYLVIGQFCLAFSAALLTLGAFGLMRQPPRWIECAFAGLFVLCMHQFHRYLGLAANPSMHYGPRRYFYAHRHTLLAVCAVSAAGALACAAAIHPLILILAAMGLSFGIVYCWTTRPHEADPKGIARWFKRLGGSKDLFMAAAWTAVVVGLPFLSAWLNRVSPGALPQLPSLPSLPSLPHDSLNLLAEATPHGGWLEFLLTAAAVFLLVILRSILADLRDIDHDLLVGRDTLPTAIGMKMTLSLIISGIIFLAVILAAVLASAVGWLGIVWTVPVITFQIINVALAWRQIIPRGALWDAMIDGQILLTALMITGAAFWG